MGADRDGGSVIARNSQPLFNLDLFENMFWDGRVEFVEGEYLTPAGDQLTAAMTAVFDFGVVSAQAMFPVTDASEMRGQPGTNELADLDADDFTGIWSGLMTRLGAIPEYETLFKAAYPGVDFDDMTFAHAANAIAGFEIAAFDHRDNPWQRFIAGDDDAMDADARRGAHLFYSINCQGCHSGAVGSDFGFHNLVLAQFGPGKGHGTDDIEDFGREAITGDEEQRYEFRTPPFFNVDLTGPYGHLGQFTEIRHHMRTYGSPRFWRNTYTIERQVADESLWATLVDNATEVHDARETVELVADVFSDDGQLPQHLSFLESFMSAQTDEQALDMSHLVPASVPSGLAVED